MLFFIGILLFNTNKINVTRKCEYNMDCYLPQICCNGIFIKYCCIPKGLILSPIPINK